MIVDQVGAVTYAGGDRIACVDVIALEHRSLDLLVGDLVAQMASKASP